MSGISSMISEFNPHLGFRTLRFGVTFSASSVQYHRGDSGDR
jgi:hypothetical protein